MPWGAVAGVVGSVAGAGISSALSPSTTGGGSNYYTPTGLSAADTNWQNLLTQEMGTYGNFGQLTPLYQQSLTGTINNPYSNWYQSQAGAAGNQDLNLANLLQGQANSNFSQQNALLNAGANVFNLGLDPQNALYSQTLNNVQQQVNANNSAYGLGSSAAGAGVANQAISNFNMDWQNNQLSRALQGLQGYTGAANTAGQYGQLGTQQYSAVPGYTLASGQTPYQTATSLAGVPGQAASTYASGLETGPLAAGAGITGQIIPYLNYGAGAQATPFQTASQGAGAFGSAVSQGIQGLGTAYQNAGSFGNLFNGTTGSFGGGNYGGAFTSSPYYSGGGNSYGFTLQ
jgi:hypothetical protein